MNRLENTVHFSATDLTNFLACSYLTYLDRLALDKDLVRALPDEQAELIQAKGLAHERDYHARLLREGKEIVECKPEGASWSTSVARTLEAFKNGAEVIYQAHLTSEQFHGVSDFLLRVETPSKLGSFSYEPLDTKLASLSKPSFIIQLCLYAELLSAIQGVLPGYIHVGLGSGETKSFRLKDFFSYYRKAKERFLDYIDTYNEDREPCYPEPTAHCSVCHWRDHCAERRDSDDHLSLVANIRKNQIKRLSQGGITTVQALALADTAPAAFSTPVFSRLQKQATLQIKKRKTGEHYYELTGNAPVGKRLLDLPEPHPADIFYDIEGDPLLKDPSLSDSFPNLRNGLEYLHGVYIRHKKDESNDNHTFKAFWTIEKGLEEKRSFEALVDFFTAHLAANPGAHIYHYASYEISALKRLMCQYGTREDAVDDLLRRQIFVDLYQTVRHNLITSEPRYSIKNLEVFYMGKRQQDLKSGGASIIYFERYLETRDDALKDEIIEYNRIDCESTYLLREWLLELRDTHGLRSADTAVDETAIASAKPLKAVNEERAAENARKRQEALERRQSIIDGLGKPPTVKTPSAAERARQLLCDLVDYYQREDKPVFWELYRRRDYSEAELFEDSECLAGAVLDRSVPPEPVDRSYIHTYRYPPQETKVSVGSKVKDIASDKDYELYSLSIDTSTLQLKLGKKAEVPEQLSLIPWKKFPSEQLRAALHRFLEYEVKSGILCGKNGATPERYHACYDIIQRASPRFKSGRNEDLISCPSDSKEFLPNLIELVEDLDSSYLFIQGPPGTGKSYTGARLLLALLKSGKRVGVTSNSHKAVNNLLQALERAALLEGYSFVGVKKFNSEPEKLNGAIIRDVDKDVWSNDESIRLIAGTSWVFVSESLDLALDYLVIDEAGQLSIARALSVGVAAKNVILLGDPMQLSQPSQGIHPGDSGRSALEYLLDGSATVLPSMGVLLDTTWRLHEHLCTFLSEHVYDGKLHAQADTSKQMVQGMLPDPLTGGLLADGAGVRFLSLQHAGNSSSCKEEAEAILTLYKSLLGSTFTDKEGCTRTLTSDDVLIVAPYNLQVHLLQSVVGSEARVGTIDKFQGQEAPVVLISMTSSSGDDLPRQIDFLFSKNRLNVALSRAMSLAIVVLSDQLTSVQCSTMEQMTLVNTLCALEYYAVAQR